LPLENVGGRGIRVLPPWQYVSPPVTAIIRTQAEAKAAVGSLPVPSPHKNKNHQFLLQWWC